MNAGRRPEPPLLTPEDRKVFLEKAKQARGERAHIKELISHNTISIFDAINDPRQSIQRMKVTELLGAVPGVGPARARSIMEKCGISESRRIAGLGRHQLHKLRREVGVMKVDPQHGALLVMSGPGGVGKSTFSTLISQCLASLDHEVGLLDLDLCGPSIPQTTNLNNHEVH